MVFIVSIVMKSRFRHPTFGRSTRVNKYQGDGECHGCSVGRRVTRVMPGLRGWVERIPLGGKEFLFEVGVR
jgi:hypothetical protein